MKRMSTIKFLPAALGCALLLAGCGGAGGSNRVLAPLPFTHRALVVGAASSPVLTELGKQYSPVSGTGSEDPSNYDMVVFDAKTASPQSINANPATRAFLQAGKAVVILNDTEAQRDAALKGIVYAHAKSDSTAEAFIMTRTGGGVVQQQIDFPVHLTSSPAGAVADAGAPKSADIPVYTQRWLANLQRGLALSGGGNILPAASGTGQTVYSFDVVQPAVLDIVSAVHTDRPGYGTWCDDETPPSNGDMMYCSNQNNPNIFGPQVTVDFETMLNVLLEPNGSTYQHKVIARQYALMSTSAYPGSDWQYAYWGANSSGNTYYDDKLVTTVGFNEAVTLYAGPAWTGTSPMTVVEAEPQVANNTSQLTTSTSHSESVGLSVTGGWQGGGVGLLGANWSDTWSWSQSKTVNISDWSSTFNQDANFGLTYQFAATGGTPNTFSTMQGDTYSPGDNGHPELQTGAWNLNGLQSSSVVAQDETTWLSTNGPVAPGEQTFNANAKFTSGEVFGIFGNCCSGPNVYFANLPYSVVDEPIVVDFANPSIQPPAAAPWTLSFGGYSQSQGSDYATTTGTVTLNQPASSPTTVYLSYVIQPQQQMLTLPSGEACQGNTTSFNPGSSIVNNGSPPLSITIPAGKNSANFSLTFQTFNSSTYNVQVVAWLPSTTMNGQSVTNPQSAWCLTPPNTPF